MNNQLKLLIYIALVALIFYFVQDKFQLFDISFEGGELFQTEQTGEENTPIETEDNSSDIEYVDIQNSQHNTVRVSVDVADTEVERSTGLAGRRNLGDYEGMLFIMDGEVSTPFWMKGMYIDLDILFIDGKGFIVDIKENEKACSADFCPNIYSSKPYYYVLEVNSGFCETNKVVVGNSIILNISEN